MALIVLFAQEALVVCRGLLAPRAPAHVSLVTCNLDLVKLYLAQDVQQELIRALEIRPAHPVQRGQRHNLGLEAVTVLPAFRRQAQGRLCHAHPVRSTHFLCTINARVVILTLLRSLEHLEAIALQFLVLVIGSTPMA